MLTITNTTRDITKCSNKRYNVTHSFATARDINEAKQKITEICRYLRLDPAEFLVTDESGKTRRFTHRNPAVFTG